MRTNILAITAVAFAFACTGCTGPVTEVAAQGGTPPIGMPVGPIPGGQVQLNARSNPYGQDPVALSEGRRLFVSYNCSGCHGGHAGGGMGPSLRDQDWIYGGTDAQI